MNNLSLGKILEHIESENVKLIFSPTGSFGKLLNVAQNFQDSDSIHRLTGETQAAQKILDMQESGELIIAQPNIEKIPFLQLMYDNEVPIPLTWYSSDNELRILGTNEDPNIDTLLGRYFNGGNKKYFWLRKDPGLHNSDGIFILLPDKKLLVPSGDNHLYQELIRPPKGVEYIRELRFMIVDGEIVNSYCKSTKYPIVNKKGSFLNSADTVPDTPQVFAKLEYGTQGFPVQETEYQKSEGLARKAFKLIRDNFGTIAGSIDVLLGEEPLITEAHSAPGIMNQPEYIFGLVDYLKQIAGEGKIMLFEKSPTNTVLKALLGNSICMYV